MEGQEEKVVLRLPVGVRAAIQHAARNNGRSMNSQLIQYAMQGLRLDGFDVPRHEKENARAAVTARASVSLPTQ